MGKAASSLGRRAVRPFREFNLEQRVTKELSREKRAVAPRHQTTAALINNTVKEQPKEVKNNLQQKDDLLLDRLKSVYVTSQDVMPDKKVIEDNPDRPLPSERSNVEDPEFGFHEPRTVPYGKVTLRNAVEAITRHQEDPILWSPRRLALEYKLSIELTEKMLRHFRMFIKIIPPDSKEKITASAQHHTPLTAPHTIMQLPQGLTAPPQHPHNKDKDKS